MTLLGIPNKVIDLSKSKIRVILDEASKKLSMFVDGEPFLLPYERLIEIVQDGTIIHKLEGAGIKLLKEEEIQNTLEKLLDVWNGRIQIFRE